MSAEKAFVRSITFDCVRFGHVIHCFLWRDLLSTEPLVSLTTRPGTNFAPLPGPPGPFCSLRASSRRKQREPGTALQMAQSARGASLPALTAGWTSSAIRSPAALELEAAQQALRAREEELKSNRKEWEHSLRDIMTMLAERQEASQALETALRAELSAKQVKILLQ
jgi:hypothetical protein